MLKYIKQFANHTAYQSAESNLDKPNVTLCTQENEIHYNPFHDYSKDYLTFVALEDTQFKLSKNDIYYSLDNGNNWTQLLKNTYTPIIQSGNKIIFKAELVPASSTQFFNFGIGTFSSTGRYEAEGNIMSLLYGNNFNGQISLSGKKYAFTYLFQKSSNLVNAINLVLPATTLSQECYSLMFEGCTSLLKAPVLPALTLYSGCYTAMFENCTSLNYIKAMFTDHPGRTYTDGWVEGVATSGTFVKNAAATWTDIGVSGVPSNWTIQTASE